MHASVTNLAVIRYCERILEMETPRAESPADQALALADALGVDLAELRAMVCPPVYWPTVLAGATTIRTDTHIMKCGSDHCVITVVKTRRQAGHRLKMPTRRESRRGSRRFNRNQRRRRKRETRA